MPAWEQFSLCSYLDQGRLKCSRWQDVSVPANVEQIIVHCNCTSISFRDAEWAAYSPWISAQVKNLYIRYHVASIIPSHSIPVMRQAAVRSPPMLKLKRNYIAPRQETGSLTGHPPRQLPSGSVGSVTEALFDLIKWAVTNGGHET